MVRLHAEQHLANSAAVAPDFLLAVCRGGDSGLAAGHAAFRSLPAALALALALAHAPTLPLS